MATRLRAKRLLSTPCSRPLSGLPGRLRSRLLKRLFFQGLFFIGLFLNSLFLTVFGRFFFF